MKSKHDKEINTMVYSILIKCFLSIVQPYELCALKWLLSHEGV